MAAANAGCGAAAGPEGGSRRCGPEGRGTDEGGVGDQRMWSRPAAAVTAAICGVGGSEQAAVASGRRIFTALRAAGSGVYKRGGGGRFSGFVVVGGSCVYDGGQLHLLRLLSAVGGCGGGMPEV